MDKCADCLASGRLWVVGVGKGHFGVEEGFDGTVAVLGTEHLVPSIGHFEGFPGVLACDVHVCAAGLGVPAETAGTGPDGYDAFFKFREDALFLEVAEGGVRFCVWGEGAEGGLGGRTSIDGGF